MTAATLDALRARVAAGAGPGDTRQLPDRVQRAVTVAGVVGAPLAPTVAVAASVLDDERAAEQAVRVEGALDHLDGVEVAVLAQKQPAKLGQQLGQVTARVQELRGSGCLIIDQYGPRVFNHAAQH